MKTPQHRGRSSRVYVLGAGFSKSYHPGFVPLMADFLQIAKTNARYDLLGRHSNLAQFIARYFGYAEYHDLEKVMSFLSAPAQDEAPIDSANRAVLYDELLRVIQDTLAHIHLTAASETTRSIYEAFAQMLVTSRSLVISLNYDLVLDSLLYKTGEWIGYDGYGADIPSAFQALPRPTRRELNDYVPPEDKRSKTYLLKLHGSINWGVPTIHTGTDSMIYQDPHGCYHAGYLGGARTGPSPLHDTSISPAQFPLTMRFKPFLVPPILDKTSLLDSRPLRVLWNMASAAITDADELVFVGYSLPMTDFATEFLFRRAVRRSKNKRVTVVAPDAERTLLPRYRDVFGDHVVAIDDDTLGWLATCEASA